MWTKDVEKREEFSEEAWTPQSELKGFNSTASDSRLQAKDLLSSHLKENITEPKAEFERFIASFPAPLYYFAQNQKTSHFIDAEDVTAMLSAKNTREKYNRMVLMFTITINMSVMERLHESNKIFGLTHRKTIPGVLFKYFILPLGMRQIFDTLFFYPQYRQTRNRIQSKYNFQDFIFREEYEHDPDPAGSIQAYLRSRHTVKTPGPDSSSNKTGESNDQKS